MLLSEAIAEFINQGRFVLEWSEHTLGYYERYCKDFLDFTGDKYTSELTYNHIDKWRMHLHETNSGAQRNRALVLRRLIKFLHRKDYSSLNFEYITLPKTKTALPKNVDTETITKLVRGAIHLRDKVLILLLYSSGVRISEARNLKVADIKGKEFRVKGKSKSERICYINDETKHMLDLYLKWRLHNSEYVFINDKDGKQMSYRTVQYNLETAQQRAGITEHITPHTLRHTYGTELARAGAPIPALSRLMGHENMRTTQQYIHVTNEDAKLAHKKLRELQKV